MGYEILKYFSALYWSFFDYYNFRYFDDSKMSITDSNPVSKKTALENEFLIILYATWNERLTETWTSRKKYRCVSKLIFYYTIINAKTIIEVFKTP